MYISARAVKRIFSCKYWLRYSRERAPTNEPRERAPKFGRGERPHIPVPPLLGMSLKRRSSAKVLKRGTALQCFTTWFVDGSIVHVLSMMRRFEILSLLFDGSSCDSMTHLRKWFCDRQLFDRVAMVSQKISVEDLSPWTASFMNYSADYRPDH